MLLWVPQHPTRGTHKNNYLKHKYRVMRVLELYSGSRWGENVFKEFGIKAISIRMDMFDYSLYPRDGFDMVFININGNSLGFYDDIEFGDMELGLDLIEYYNPKHWLIINGNKQVMDDIMMWGLPYKNIRVLRGGKLSRKRFWSNIHSWGPGFSKIYIRESYILSELFKTIK